MDFKSQIEPLSILESLRNANRQGILIEGPKGSGKTYLAKQYARMLNVSDFVSIEPKVDAIKNAVDGCISLENSILLCIENLDTGVAGASYALLKFLEEPISNVYIVITCRNIRMIPDTIISRSAVVTLGPPTRDDLNKYAESSNFDAYMKCNKRSVWQAAQSLTDVDAILHMNEDELTYYDNLAQICKCTDNVSSIVWAISHYSHNNQECNLELSIRCIMRIMRTSFVTKCGIECIRDLTQSRIAKHAILSKFAFNIKYCE